MSSMTCNCDFCKRVKIASGIQTKTREGSDGMICPECHEVHDYTYKCMDADERRFREIQRICDAYEEYRNDLLYGETVANTFLYQPWGVFAGPNLQIFDPIIFTGDKSKLKIGKNVRIDSFVKIEIGNGVEIGDNTHIASFAHLIGGGTVKIGARSAVASGSKIVSGANPPDAQSATATAPETSGRYRGRVTIGDDATVYVNCVVLPDVTIGNGSRLGAGSVLKQDIPPGEIWAGVPAKFIRKVKR